MPEFKLPTEDFLTGKSGLQSILDSLDRDGTFGKDLEQSLKDNGFEPIKNDKDENIGFKGADGEPIDKDAMKRIKEKMNGNFDEKSGKYVYDLEGILSDLNFKPEEIKDNKASIDDLRQKVENSTGFKDLTDQRQRTQNGQNATQRLGTPTSESEFQNSLSRLTEENKKKFEQLEKDLKDKKDSSVGKWIKRGLLAYAGFSLYEAIKAHQNAMNGCWLYDTSTGGNNKCKITDLTCNPDCKNNITKDYSYCASYCTTCPDKTKASSQPNLCIVGAISDPTCKDCKNTLGNNMCASCEGDKSDASCSSKCKSENFNLAPGYILQCQDVDFWTAAGDLSQQPINFATNLAQQLLTIFKYVAIGIAILIGIYVVLQVILYLLHRNSSEKGEEGEEGESEGKGKLEVKYEKSSSSRRKR